MDHVSAHGRLMEPVSRASAWRKGYNVPADYTDNQGFCGGVDVRELLRLPFHFVYCSVFQPFLDHGTFFD
jgi:hypothetical protein